MLLTINNLLRGFNHGKKEENKHRTSHSQY
jgi:hypothetical protein